MKKIMITIVLLFSINTTYAQEAIAKLKFQQAEEYFTSSDYEKALLKLKEACAILGTSNPKIEYLTIQCQNQIIETNGLKDFKIVEDLRQNCANYLKKYDKNLLLEEKYIEVYKITEKLDKYPKTITEFNIIKKEQEERINDENNNKAKLEASINYVNSLADKYKFKRGLTLSEFVQNNPESMSLSKRKPDTFRGGLAYFSVVGSGNPYQIGPGYIHLPDSNLVTTYSYNFATSKGNEEEIDNLYEEFISKVKYNVNSEFIKPSVNSGETFTIEGYEIKVPGSKTSIIIFRRKFNNWNSATIKFN